MNNEKKQMLNDLVFYIQTEISDCKEIQEDGFGLSDLGKGRLEISEEILEKLSEIMW